MLEIFNFYINLVVQIFERILNGFEVTNGVGFGTFLLACALLVVFINLLKFQFSSHGIAEIKESRKRARNIPVHYYNDKASYIRYKD